MKLSLVFDADDTLWENNIYFEEAFDRFFDYLSHSSLTPAQVRKVLDEIEIVNAKVYGYGSRKFARNLAQCYRHLAEREISEQDLSVVMDFDAFQCYVTGECVIRSDCPASDKELCKPVCGLLGYGFA